jgi:hypothetical protein
MTPTLEKLLGANYRTTLSGTASAVLALLAGIAAFPDSLGTYSSLLPPTWRDRIFLAAAISAALLRIINAAVTKDARVAGSGAPLDPYRVDDGGIIPRKIP